MEGHKYQRDRSTNDIAKCIRADIKAAIGAEGPWGLPKGLKVSVRLKKYSGGCSISAAITHCEGALLNPAHFLMAQVLPHDRCEYPRYTREGARILSVLDGLMAAYNYDRSDIQVDYFDVRFYAHVDVHWQYESRLSTEFYAAAESLCGDLRVGMAAEGRALVFQQLDSLNEGFANCSNEREALRELLYPTDAGAAA